MFLLSLTIQFSMQAAFRAPVLAERSMNYEKSFLEEWATAKQLRGELKTTQAKTKEAEAARDFAQAQLH